jgi:hypothetical protein
LPVLLDTAQILGEWVEAHPQESEIPRLLGFHRVRIGHGDAVVETDRAVIPYSLWMLQRVADHLAGLTGADRSAADRLLRSIGAQQLADFGLPVRLERRHFKLARA